MPTPQTPINTGFTAVTTAREVIQALDLRGKTAIVTGGYTGIGLETTRALLKAGAGVIVPARAPGKARSALATLSGAQVEPMDLLEPNSIDAFATAFLKTGRALDILINNAGIMANPLTRDARGFEAQFATNHLGHFQLTARLWPALQKAAVGRVVSLSSRAHQSGEVNFADPNFEHRPYDRWQAYAQSKTANILFAVELDARAAAHGVRAFAVHPGLIMTDLSKHMTNEELAGYSLSRTDIGSGVAPKGRSVSEGGIFKSIEQGAATSVWCATSPLLRGRGGVYCEDVNIAPLRAEQQDDPHGANTLTHGHGVAPHAVDPVAARALWKLSEKLTGLIFEL